MWNFGIGLISGVSLGIEYTENDFFTGWVLDVFILRFILFKDDA